eukprot:4883814-Amphidinium_carterae.1
MTLFMTRFKSPDQPTTHASLQECRETLHVGHGASFVDILWRGSMRRQIRQPTIRNPYAADSTPHIGRSLRLLIGRIAETGGLLAEFRKTTLAKTEEGISVVPRSPL